MDSYEKRYKEALNKAKAAYGTGAYDDQTLEAIFPELVESEDERIRKEIISALKFANDGGVYDEHIAYLEKQKEQKPVGQKVSRAQIHHELLQNGTITMEEYLKLTENLYFPKRQKPADWSEEDEKMLKNVLFVLESYVSQSESASSPSLITTYPTYYKEIDWLKSLRPQYHGDVTMTEAYKMGLETGKASSWKPSEEHFQALRRAIMKADKGSDAETWLIDLCEQLRKL